MEELKHITLTELSRDTLFHSNTEICTVVCHILMKDNKVTMFLLVNSNNMKIVNNIIQAAKIPMANNTIRAIKLKLVNNTIMVLLLLLKKVD